MERRDIKQLPVKLRRKNVTIERPPQRRMTNNEPEEAWMAIFLGAGEAKTKDDGYEAKEILLSDEHGDDVEEGTDKEMNPLVNVMGMNLHIDNNEMNLLDEPEAFTPQTIALITNEPESAHLEAIEVYDSGCTKHMTSYHHCLSNFQLIPPKVIGAASQVTFSAIGAGDMIVRTLNGGELTKIKLRDVLYAPNLRCTLISIREIDNARYTITFRGGKCVIQNHEDQVIAQIPKTQGLYHMEHESSA